MRKYIGHKLKLVISGFNSVVSGKMIEEDPYFIYLKSEVKDETWRLSKDKICGFTVVGQEPEPFVPFLVLCCDCKEIGCEGVKYIKEGKGFKQTDFDTFTSQCPRRNDKCRFGSRGELRSLSSETLKEMLSGLLLGEYPEKEVKSVRNRKSNTKTESSETEG